jgi:HD superfamily phosphodiesterase
MSEQKTLNNALREVLDILDPYNHYPYHNIAHTLDVYNRATYLCDREFVSKEEKTDILLAALFHDTGFSVSYDKNEYIWAEIAGEYLRSIWWDLFRIERVQRIILSTILFSPATDLLDKIMKDADMDNLWRNDFLIKNMLYFRELHGIAWKVILPLDWLLQSKKLLENYQFFTITSQQERDPLRLKHLEKMTFRHERMKHFQEMTLF